MKDPTLVLLAHGAQVPILLTYFDFPRKVVGFGPLFVTTGDVERDMKIVLDYFRADTRQIPQGVAGDLRQHRFRAPQCCVAVHQQERSEIQGEPRLHRLNPDGHPNI